MEREEGCEWLPSTTMPSPTPSGGVAPGLRRRRVPTVVVVPPDDRSTSTPSTHSPPGQRPTKHNKNTPKPRSQAVHYAIAAAALLALLLALALVYRHKRTPDASGTMIGIDVFPGAGVPRPRGGGARVEIVEGYRRGWVGWGRGRGG